MSLLTSPSTADTLLLRHLAAYLSTDADLLALRGYTVNVMISAPPNYGAFASEGAALEAVLSRLAEALRPFRIYLFGSRAEGRARPDSDFDLLVVFEDEATNNDADYHAVSEPLRGLGIGCDVVPCLKSEFEEVLADPTNPWQKVWAAAKRVYERPK